MSRTDRNLLVLMVCTETYHRLVKATMLTRSATSSLHNSGLCFFRTLAGSRSAVTEFRRER